MQIKCERCGKIFSSNSIKRRFCDECVKTKIKDNKVKYLNKRYANDNEFAEKIKDKKRDKFIFDNYYGLILGTTDFGGHRHNNFKKEAEIIRKEKYRVLNGKTYTDKKYLDLCDENIEKTNKSTIKKKKKGITLPKELNNFNDVEIVNKKIIKDLNIKTNKIYGTLKININDYFDKYIMFCKVNGRITENIIYTKKDLYV